MSTTYHDAYWAHGIPFETFLASVEEKADLWESYAGRAKVHADEAARVQALPARRRVLVLVEDWCGDAIRSVPTLEALARASEHVDLRVLSSDQYPEALTSKLTRGARAIPIAVVFDEEGHEIGTWGPRPAPLQAILRAKILEEGSPTPEIKGEFYAPVMAWYAKDRGRTVAQEMLMVLERDSAVS